MGKRRKSKVDESTLSAEERERRRVQRERRELAIKQRSQGKRYIPHKVAKFQPWRENPMPSNNKNRGESRAERRQKGKAIRATCPYDVVVVPISWRKRAEESDVVNAAARKLHEVVSTQGGLRSVCDEDTELAPGQKYRKYENMGVKVRLEVGPAEADPKSGAFACVLAKTTTPGEMAKKTNIAPHGDVDKLMNAIKEQLGTSANDASQ